MRNSMYVWTHRDHTRVGTTSGSGGSEHFVTPEESQRAHLKAPIPDKTFESTPENTSVTSDTGSLEGTEAGADNPTRGLD